MQCTTLCTANSQPLCSAHFLGNCMLYIKDLIDLLGNTALQTLPLSLDQMPGWSALAVLNQATVWQRLLPMTCG